MNARAHAPAGLGPLPEPRFTFVDPGEGIEPPQAESKSAVLPLDDPGMDGAVGFEPTTPRIRAECSTTEPRPLERRDLRGPMQKPRMVSPAVVC